MFLSTNHVSRGATSKITLAIATLLLLAMFLPALFAFAEAPMANAFPDENTAPAAAGILIFGATGGTGLATARLLTERGNPVTAFVRPTSDRTELEQLGVSFVTGDALNADEVTAAFNAGTFRAVISTLGCFRCEQPPDYIGNRNVFDAASAAGVRRVILVSTIGASESEDAMPWIVSLVLSDVTELKTRAEAHLRASDLDYTIIRPGGLANREPTGNGVLDSDPMSMGIITRPDLAALLVDVLDDPSTYRRAYSAMDTELSWPWDMWN